MVPWWSEAIPVLLILVGPSAVAFDQHQSPIINSIQNNTTINLGVGFRGEMGQRPVVPLVAKVVPSALTVRPLT